MANPINIKDLVDFSDPSQVDRFAESIGGLLKSYQGLIKASAQGAKDYKRATDEIVASLTKQEEALRKRDITLEKDRAAIIKDAEAVQKASTVFNELTAAEAKNAAIKKQLTQNVRQLSAAKKELDTETKKASASTKTYSGSVNELKEKVKQARAAFEGMAQDVDPFLKSRAIENYKKYKTQLDQATASLKVNKAENTASKGSYNELSKEVLRLQKELKNLPDAFGKNQKQAEALQKTLFKKTQTLKDFDASINVHNRNVGNYTSVLKDAALQSGLFGGNIGRLGQLAGVTTGQLKGATGMLGKLRVALISTGLGALLVILGSLVAYFSSTNDGAEEMARIMARIGAVTDVVIGRFARFGGQLVEFAKSIESPLDLLKKMGKIFVDLHKDPIKTLKDIKQGFVDFADEAGKAADEAARIADAIDAVEDSERESLVSREKDLGLMAQLIKTTRERTLSEQQRLDNLKKAGEIETRLSEQEIGFAQKSLDIANDELKQKIKNGTVTDADRQKAVDAEVALIKLQNESLLKRQDIKNRESQFINELKQEREKAAKEELDRQRELANAAGELAKFRLEQEINVMVKITENERTSNDERESLFQEISQKRVAIAVLERDALLRNTELLAAEETLILEQFAAKVKSIAEQLVLSVAFDPNRANKDAEEVFNAKLLTLAKEREAAIENGEELQKIDEDFAEKQFQLEDELLQQHVDNLKAAYGYEEEATQAEIDLYNKRYEHKKALREQEAAEEEERKELLLEQGQELYDSSLAFVDALNERANADREAKLLQLEEDKNRELELAGDNVEAKKRIEVEYAKKQDEIRKQQAEARRRQAIFEKVIAATEIGIQTGIAIVKAVAASPVTGGLPFSAIAAAIGGLQLAAVLAKPIPKFAKGTEDAPEGWALVGEQGPELRYLNKGDKIKTANQTKEIMKSWKMVEESRIPANVLSSYLQSYDSLKKAGANQLDSKAIEQIIKIATDKNNSELIEELRSLKQVNVTVDKKGVQVWAKENNERTEYLNNHFYR